MTVLRSGTAGFDQASCPDIAVLPGAGIHPLDPATFRASVRWVRLDGLLIRVFVAEPHVFEAVPTGADEEPVVSIGVIGSGSIDGRCDGTDLHLDAGEAVAVRSDRPMSYTAREPVRMLTVLLDTSRLPPHLRTMPRPVLPLRRTPLLDSYLAFVSALMRQPADGVPGADHAHLGQAFADLHVAVLAEASALETAEPGADLLRLRIAEHVEAHLTDPGLTPGSIAVALGISLRRAHQVFDRDGVTLARFVRERRLEALTSALDRERLPLRLDELAERFGFSSRDQLTRAFRRLHGTTPTHYLRTGPHR